MSFSAYALFPNDTPKITDEEFNIFHLIERQLYSRLIFDLGRDPEQSMRVMGFWMWLELVICTKMDLVIQLLKLPLVVVNEVADESVVCLKCMESEILPFTDGIFELVLLQKLVHEKISLELLHEIRVTVINEVTRRVKYVCVRAFKDILEKIVDKKFPMVPGGSGRCHSISTTTSPREVGWSHDYGMFSSVAAAIRNKASRCNIDEEGNLMIADGNKTSYCLFNRDGRILPTTNGNNTANCNGVGLIGNKASCFTSIGDGRICGTAVGNKASRFIGVGGYLEREPIIPFPYALGYKPVIGFPIFPPAEVLYRMPPGGKINIQQILAAENVLARARRRQELQSCELNAIFGRLSVSGNIDNVLPDDRTIFLTFSKGYPVSELEVGTFFTRKFGDFIDAIHMHEVPPSEQSLYARVVSRSAAMVDIIVAGDKAKYNINGKHVWARKYVKKHK